MMARSTPPRIDGSVIVPVLDEAESVPVLISELREVLAQLPGPWEVIFVDDGSTDNTWEVLARFAEQHSAVRAIRLARNHGKSAAYMSGFRAARGKIIVTLDGDLQDDPSEIPRMLETLRAKRADLVVGWKQGRERNEPHKKAPSAVYNAIKSKLFGLNLRDSNSGFRIMQHGVADSIQLYGDQYRFIPELAHLQGFHVTQCRVRHRPRKYGQSKYGPMRFFTGLLDLLTLRFLTLYSRKPLHFFGAVSLVPFTLGVGLEMYVLAQKFLFASQFRTHMAAIVIGVLCIMVAVQLLSIGLIGEMLAAQRQGVAVQERERVGFDR